MWQDPQGICSDLLCKSGKLGCVCKILNVDMTKLVSFFCLQFLWISLSLIFFTGDALVFKLQRLSYLFSK